jgi:enamine deaminase RidA (YjgF/YER057c/UK114 family)
MTTPAAGPAGRAPHIEHLNPEGLANFGTFSQVATARGGKTIHVSGQVAWNAQGAVVGPGDLAVQTVQVFENLKVALAAAGAGFRDVVKFTIYVVDLKPQDRSVISEIRGRYIEPDCLPASTMIGVAALVMAELRIEVEAVAVVG